jgi:hypothetical protein
MKTIRSVGFRAGWWTAGLLAVWVMPLRAATAPSDTAPAAPRTVKAQVVGNHAECYFHKDGLPLELVPIQVGTEIEVVRVGEGRCFFTYRNRPAYIGEAAVVPVDESGQIIRDRTVESFFPKPPKVVPVKPVEPLPVVVTPPEPPKPPVSPLPPELTGAGPKAICIAFAKAFMAGDNRRAKALCVPDPKMAELVDTMAPALLAVQKLEKALLAKWGPDAPKKFGLGTNLVTSNKMLDVLEEATEEIKGDRAQVLVKDDPDPTKLRKVEGEWRMEIPDLSKFGVSGPAELKLLKTASKAFDGLAGEIAAGRYRTIEEAQLAFVARLGVKIPTKPPGGS